MYCRIQRFFHPICGSIRQKMHYKYLSCKIQNKIIIYFGSIFEVIINVNLLT